MTGSQGNAATQPRAGAPGQGRRDERPHSGDRRRSLRTDGLRLGLSEHELRVLGWAALLSAAIISLVIGVNVITRVHNEPDRALIALVEEGTSFVTVLAASSVPMMVALWMRRRAPRRIRLALVIVLGFGAFFVVHVGGFVLLRRLVFAAA